MGWARAANYRWARAALVGIVGRLGRVTLQTFAPCERLPPAGPGRTWINGCLAAGCWLFGGQRICNPQAFSQGLGWAASVARLVAIGLGLGLVSRIWGLPGQRQEGQLAAASDQADRPGVRPLLGGMKAGGKGGIGSPRV